MFVLLGLPETFQKGVAHGLFRRSGTFDLIGVLTGVVSCFYYLRMVCVIFLLGFIFYPGPLFMLSHKLALYFCV